MAQLNVRIDETLKRSVEGIIGSLGLSHSDVIRIFYHQIMNHNGIPFALTLHEPTESTKEAMAEFETGNGLPRKYTDSKTLMADLLKD